MNKPVPAPCFFALSESREQGRDVAHTAGLALAGLEERTFEGGEFKLRPLETVRGRVAYVYQSLAGSPEASVSARLHRLLFLLSGLRDAGAERCIALIPYLAFARQDRRTEPRDPVNTRYIAELLEAAGASGVMALDVHNPAAFDNAFRIPTDHLTALPMFADHFSRGYAASDLVIVSPDVGGIKRVQIFRELLEERLGGKVELAFIEKRRAPGIVSGGTLVGMSERRPVVILLDDLCATGGTLVRAASICRHAGAATIHVAVTHAPLDQGIKALMATDAIDSVVTTDSVGVALSLDSHFASADASKIVTLPIAPLFGEAVRRILAGMPVSALLSQWPVAAD
jgi:ribose-phosphate pyrophosphokinase